MGTSAAAEEDGYGRASGTEDGQGVLRLYQEVSRYLVDITLDRD